MITSAVEENALNGKVTSGLVRQPDVMFVRTPRLLLSMRLELLDVWGLFCFSCACLSGLHTGLLGVKSISSSRNSLKVSSLEEEQTDRRCSPLNASKSSHKLLHQFVSVSHLILFKSLSTWIACLSSALFHSALCVKCWLEGSSLEKTWDPIIDTSIMPLHATPPLPVSHMLAAAAGLCLPGTRHTACLSHSKLQFLLYYKSNRGIM